MGTCMRHLTGVALVLLMTSAAPAGFICYNDFGGTGSGYSGGNVTAFTGATGGTLIDYDTGASTGITMALDTGGGYWFRDEGGMTAGTPAYDVFNGKVNVAGQMGNANASPYVITFTGLDPSGLYEVVLFGDRSFFDPPTGATLNVYTISDTETASSFTNVSSGTISGANNETATMNVGNNTPTGYIGHYTNIRSGSDGDFRITVTAAGGDSAWRLNAMALMPEPATLALLGLGLAGCLRRFRK